MLFLIRNHRHDNFAKIPARRTSLFTANDDIYLEFKYNNGYVRFRYELDKQEFVMFVIQNTKYTLYWIYDFDTCVERDLLMCGPELARRANNTIFSGGYDQHLQELGFVFPRPRDKSEDWQLSEKMIAYKDRDEYCIVGFYSRWPAWNPGRALVMWFEICPA